METYSFHVLRRHWLAISKEFSATYSDCIVVFDQMLHTASIVVDTLVHQRELTANCAYLLIAKSLNHVFASYLLIERGLLVDAALVSRNGIETMLLLELLMKQPDLCEKWIAGTEFRPGEVRKRLSQLQSVDIGDLNISVSKDEYDDVQFAYNWLSRITHANLESLDHVATSDGKNAFKLHIGGALSRPVVIALITALGVTFLRTLLTCTVVHAPRLFATNRSDFELLEQQVAGRCIEASG